MLPIYDEYFVAYRERRHITTRLEGDMFGNHLVVDGKLIGSWRAHGAELVVTPHTPMDERHRALAEREMRRYARFATG